MTSATRRVAAVIALSGAALTAAACGAGGTGAGSRTSATANVAPTRILRAPKNLMAVTEPQSDGSMWALAGGRSVGLYQIDRGGQVRNSLSVSGAARSMAQSAAGVIGLALGTNRAGALDLIDVGTGKLARTVPLPAPARQVTLGSDGTTFYVLSGWANSASVAIINSRTGKTTGTVPVPADAVSAVPDVQQSLLYVLERNGLIDEISILDHKVTSRFGVGHDPGRALAVSPDGATLFVLKGTADVDNIAVVSVATQSVERVLPAPRHCVQVLVSPGGTQLFEVAGTASYGNIQVFVV